MATIKVINRDIDTVLKRYKSGKINKFLAKMELDSMFAAKSEFLRRKK